MIFNQRGRTCWRRCRLEVGHPTSLLGLSVGCRDRARHVYGYPTPNRNASNSATFDEHEEQCRKNFGSGPAWAASLGSGPVAADRGLVAEVQERPRTLVC